MAANTADTLNNIESALGSISSSLGGFIGNKNYDDGIAKIESILTNNFRKTSAKNSTLTGTTNGNRTLGNTVGEILGTLKNIDKHFNGTGSVNKGIKDVNQTLKDACTLLERIEQHIGNVPTNASVSNASSTSIDNIDKNVANIYEELRKITLVLARNSFKTGNSDLDKKLLKIAEMKADKEEKALRYSEIEEKVKSGKASKLEKDYIRLKAKRDKKGEEELEEIKSGTSKKAKLASKIIKGISDTFTDFVREKPDASKTIDKGISAISNLGTGGAIAGALLQAVKALFDLGAKQDKATTEFARAVGGFSRGKYIAGETTRSMIRSADVKRGYTADAAYSAMTEIAEARGRTTERMSQDALKSAIDLRRFGIGADAINNFDTFGKSIEETDRYFAKLYSEVSKKGLSFKNVSKAVNDNLKAAQSHTFANGLRGLEAMAERSVQLKYNMQQVFQLADKVSEIEGAIGTAANLSVLGGTFAQYSNPMQMLYEGLNDTEAMQKRLESMFADKAQWNSQTGQIDMTGLQREFVKQGAKAMGVDPNEMITMAMNQAKFRQVEKQIGPGLSKETTEYIKNIAELDKHGKAFVNLNGQNIDVSKLTEADKEMLEKESKEKNKADNAKLGDIYQNTMSISEKMDNILVYLQEKLGQWVFSILQALPWAKDWRAEAQGTGTKEEMEMRGKLFDAYSGTDPRGYARKLSGLGSLALKGMMEYQGLSKSPNGFSPNFAKPGDGGILKGESHLNGGVKGKRNGIAWEAEGGEFLINKNSSYVYRNELTKIQNGTFNPYAYSNELIKNDMSKYFNSLKVAPIPNEQATPARNEQNIPNQVNGRIKIDIPQTITINLAGGEKIGDYDIRGIVMTYVDKFMKEATMRSNFGGFNKEEFYNKSNVI